MESYLLRIEGYKVEAGVQLNAFVSHENGLKEVEETYVIYTKDENVINSLGTDDFDHFAYPIIKEALEETEQTCPCCGGEGYHEVESSFLFDSVECELCDGHGEIQIEEL